MKNNGLLWVTVILLAACGGEPEAALDLEPVPAPVEITVEAPEPKGCGMVFSPVPELLEATEIAAARWSAATGCDVRVGDGGIPVEYVDPVADGLVGENGETAAGGVYRYEETGACAKIGQVAEYSTAQTIAHEIGHCIGQPGHSDDGLMSPYAKGPLNAASLARVCDVFPCATFVPED